MGAAAGPTGSVQTPLGVHLGELAERRPGEEARLQVRLLMCALVVRQAYGVLKTYLHIMNVDNLENRDVK